MEELISFRNGNKDEFAKLPPETEDDERANIIRGRLAEVFGSPQLREAKCNTVEQLQLVNALSPLENL